MESKEGIMMKVYGIDKRKMNAKGAHDKYKMRKMEKSSVVLLSINVQTISRMEQCREGGGILQ